MAKALSQVMTSWVARVCEHDDVRLLRERIDESGHRGYPRMTQTH